MSKRVGYYTVAELDKIHKRTDRCKNCDDLFRKFEDLDADGNCEMCALDIARDTSWDDLLSWMSDDSL